MQSGYTLIEIIVAVAIAGVLISLSIAAVKTIQPTIILSDAAHNLASDIRLAQQNTLSSQKRYAVILLPPSQYSLVLVQPSTSTIKTVSISSPVFISSVSGLPDDTVIFNPAGEPNASGTITLTHTAKQIIIDIRPSGYVRIQK